MAERRRRRWARAGAAALVLAALCCGVALAAAPPSTFAAPNVITLPNGAVSGADQYSSLYGMSCLSAGNCTVGGYYADGSEEYLAMAATETNGVWGAATTVDAPSNEYSSTDPYAFLESVSCWSAGNCVGVGSYYDDETQTAEQPMYATESNGVWGTAVELTLPSNHDTNDGSSDDQNSALYGVSCTGPNQCVAVGFYRDNASPFNLQALIATDNAGSWSSTEAQLPSTGPYAAETTSGVAALNAVDCTSSGNCVAVGQYEDSSGLFHSMIDTESANAWQTAQPVTLPGNATSAIDDQTTDLWGISCPSAGNCDAVGAYDTGAESPELLSVSETAGSWQQGSEVSLPSGAGTQTDVTTTFYSVSCPAAGDCEADGSYIDGSGNSQPLIASEQGGAYNTAQESPLTGANPAVTTNDPSFAGWGVIDCVAPGECETGGTAELASTANDPVVQSSAFTLAAATSSLPGAAAGSPYAQTLTASGGIGSYTWKLASGALPPGLGLNTATGAITGTPTTPGTYAFTAGVSDPGPPSQSATAALSIDVGGPSVGKVLASGASVSVTIACGGPTGTACTGTASLSSLEHISSGTVTAITARKHHKRTRTIGDGSTHFSVAGGSSRTVTIHLSAKARALLAAHGKLPAKLTLALAGSTSPLATRTLTIKPAKPHKHHR
jgi:hypothetical protein